VLPAWGRQLDMMGVSAMDETIRAKTAVWFATAVVLSVFATLLVSQQWRADAAPGDTDSTYAPIANCRLFDFRSGGHNVGPKATPLGAGESNVYVQSVRGANGDCNIPSDAVGVAMNVTIVNPTAQSNLRVFPADISTPNASNLNWLAGQSPTPNKVDVKLSTTGEIKLYNHAGTVNVLADVVGYYTDKSLKELGAGPGSATIGQGIDWESNGNNASIVSILESGTSIGGTVTGGTAHLSLIGPHTVGDTSYTLTSVTYCVLADGTGTVDEASIIGLTPGAGSLETKDRTDRSTDGCFTIDAAADVAAADAHHLMLFVLDDVVITQVTATWDPV
jgi:hypothetical protein